MGKGGDSGRRAGLRPPTFQRSGLVIFDGDDTLWRTQELYDAAKAEFAAQMAAAGVRAPDVVRRFDEVDKERVPALGFTLERFVGSFEVTYRRLCAQESLAVDEVRIPGFDRLADPIRGDYQLYGDAVEALLALRSRARVVLFTKGQADLQQRKIERLGLERYVDRVHIVAAKDAAAFRAVADAHGAQPERTWSVGNSIRSDINPALEAGMRGVWLARPTWAYEDGTQLAGEVTKVFGLTEAADTILADLERLEA